MSPANPLLRTLLALVLLLLIGVAFAWVAWYAKKRWGLPALIASWVVSAVAVTGLMVARIHQQELSLGITEAQMARNPLLPMFLPMWAIAFGAVALVIGRQQQGVDAEFTRRLAGRSAAAFLLGVVVFFVIFAARDIGGVLRR